MRYVMLFEGFSSPKDEDFEYRGYECRIPYIERRGAYGAAVYKDGNYKYGLKGWLPLHKAIDWAKGIVNRMIENKTHNNEEAH